MAGQELVTRLAAWLRQYVWFPTPGQDLIVALWIMHTWFIDHFTSTPYLCLTARTKRAGKTTLLELVAASGQNGQLIATLRPAAIARLLHATEGRVTACFDEMESLSRGSVGDLRSIMATGYRRGQFHMVTSGDKVKAFRTFGPKAFALIGDMTDVIRDRAIILRLSRAPRGTEVLDYTNPSVRERAHAEAAELVQELKTFAERTGKPNYIAPEFLHGRESEIWLPIWTLAHHAALSPEVMDGAAGAMVDISAIKSEPAASWTALSEDFEREQEDADYSEHVLRDMRAVLREDETKIRSTDAVERLRAIPTSPWRTWRGTGLDTITLAALLSRFGVQPKSLRFGKGKAGDNSNVHKGYDAKELREVKL